MTTEIDLQCYNKGCGLKFNPDTNTEGACLHHPGVPVFHDALKGWSCCKKRSTDFTEFLNIPGCTKGIHSNEKPSEPEKPKTEDITEDQPQERKQVIVKPPEKLQRPSASEPLVSLKCTVGSSLQQLLEKQMKELSVSQGEVEEISSGEVKPGTSCKNPSCQQEYVDESTNLTTCVYHPGSPVFHEGMKYWSCCQRKTSDFNSFLSQEGCETGKHLWVKKEDGKKKSSASCRLDWHQTGNFVTISIFAKFAIPNQTSVNINKVSADISIVFNGGSSRFDKKCALFGIVDPDRSNVKLLGTKVEINLRKMEPCHWKQLELPEADS